MKKAYLGTRKHKTIGIGIDPAMPGADKTSETINNKKVNYTQDGEKIMASFDDFINIQESPCGFGDTEEEARTDLINSLSISMEDIAKIAKPYGVKIFICEVVDDMPHELITANLRSAKPFTKEAIEKFIESDETIADIRNTLELGEMELRTIYIITNE